MAHWCLRTIDYDELDVFAKPVPVIRRPHPRSRSSSVSSGGSTVSTLSNTSRGSRGKGSVKFVLPKSPESGMVRLSGPSPEQVEAKADDKLRAALVCPEAHIDIPGILADWPCTTLRLSSILSPEACSRVFPSLDQLWAHFLHGFLVRRPSCRLKRVDLTGFIPSNAMIYTFLQLIPLLSYRNDLNKKDIFDRIITTHGLNDSSILQNLSQFLDNVLRHPVFRKGRKVYLPAPFEIIMDYLPLSADRLSLYCWMMSSSLYDVTNVFVRIHTAVFTYAEPGPEFCSMDPLIPLEVFSNSSSVQDLVGLAVENVPPKYMKSILVDTLPKAVTRGFKLQRLALAHTKAELSQPLLQTGLLSIIDKCSGLTRLDLSGSRVCGALTAVLKATSLPLEFLNLSRCCLDMTDVDAIFNSKHSPYLRDLNLSHIRSNKCEECSVLRGTSPDRDVNHNAFPRLNADDAPDEPDDVISPRGGASLDFWKSQSSISSPRINIEPTHAEDRHMLETIFTRLKNLPKLTILDLLSDSFGDFRIESDSLIKLVESLQSLRSLKQINIEELPLWDEDIFSVIEAVCNNEALQSVSLSRSKEAPTLQTTDRFRFWRRMHEAKNGKILKTSIGNFVEDSFSVHSDDDSDCEHSESNT